MKALAKHLDAGTSLILLGRESSVVFYHQLKRAGATDYYPLTTAPEEIAYGVKASLEPQQEQEAPVGGRVIAVLGQATALVRARRQRCLLPNSLKRTL